MSFGNLHQQLLLLAQLDTTLVGGIPIFLRSNKNIEVNNPVVIQHFLLNKKWNGDKKFFFVLCNICLIGCFIQKSYYFRHVLESISFKVISHLWINFISRLSYYIILLSDANHNKICNNKQQYLITISSISWRWFWV